MADMTRYSIPTLLHDEDRMSMSAALEVRVPFLDYRLVELLATVAPDEKLRGGWTKMIFREAMEPLLPSEIVWRRDKKGFSLPQKRLLRNELRQTLDATFQPDMLAVRCGLIRFEKLREAYDAFQEGRGAWSDREIFRYYALEVWLRSFEEFLNL